MSDSFSRTALGREMEMNDMLIPVSNEEVSRRSSRASVIVRNDTIDKGVVLDTNIDTSPKSMYLFDKPLTLSDIRYGLFTVGPFREWLPKPGVGADQAIGVTLVNLDGVEYKSIIYYPQLGSEDMQIRNGLKPFFRKYITDVIGIDLSVMNEQLYMECVQGDIVRFFIDPNDNRRLYIKYIRRGQNTRCVRKNVEDAARRKIEEYTRRLANIKKIADEKVRLT